MLNSMVVLLAVGPLLSLAPPPYDEHADARTEIERMLECAREEQKPLLLMFGANWCEWCRGLDQILGKDKELSKLADHTFLRLNVDIGDYDRNLDVAEQYGLKDLDDTGIPMLVVLRPDGSVKERKSADDFVVGSHYAKSSLRRFLQLHAKH
jgi:thioredoxin 1